MAAKPSMVPAYLIGLPENELLDLLPLLLDLLTVPLQISWHLPKVWFQDIQPLRCVMHLGLGQDVLNGVCCDKVFLSHSAHLRLLCP